MSIWKQILESVSNMLDEIGSNPFQLKDQELSNCRTYKQDFVDMETNFPKEWKNCYTYDLLVTKKRKYKWTEQHKYRTIFVCEGKENCE